MKLINQKEIINFQISKIKTNRYELCHQLFGVVKTNRIPLHLQSRIQLQKIDFKLLKSIQVKSKRQWICLWQISWLEVWFNWIMIHILSLIQTIQLTKMIWKSFQNYMWTMHVKWWANQSLKRSRISEEII